MARPGGAWRGMARQGLEYPAVCTSSGVLSGGNTKWLGEARHGGARHGLARHGKTRAAMQRVAHSMSVLPGALCTKGLGRAERGTAWQGLARQGKTWAEFSAGWWLATATFPVETPKGMAGSAKR